MRRIPFLASIAAAGLAATSVQAGAPDFVEDFTSFTGITSASPTSPTDTGGLWTTYPLGSSPTGAFRTDANGNHGPCVTWDGTEGGGFIENQPFAGSASGGDHQIAMTFKFSAPTQGAGIDITELFGAVPVDATPGTSFTPPIINYLVAAGHNAAGSEGIFVFVPNSPGTFGPLFIPAQHNFWHRLVIQYDAGSLTNTLDAGIRVWVDSRLGTEPPNASIDPLAAGMGSFFGNGQLSRFVLGHSTDVGAGRSASGGGGSRVGSSTVKVDTVGGWYDNTGVRSGPGSLADAVAFFDSLDTTAVRDWELMN